MLLKYTHGLSALRCPRCDGAMRPVATLTDPEQVRTILTCLAIRAELLLPAVRATRLARRALTSP